MGTALSLVIATAIGASPVIRIQSAASMILVVALHKSGRNLALQRLVDALIGGGIAILIARFLFPIDPLELVRDEARQLRRRLADGLGVVADALAREITRTAPRRRPLRIRLEALGESWLELDASVSDARAIATGALRLLDGGRPAPQAAEAVRAAAAAVRALEPDEARETAEAARTAAAAVTQSDASLGANVITHGVIAVADHALRAAAAREEDSKLAEASRSHRRTLRVKS